MKVDVRFDCQYIMLHLVFLGCIAALAIDAAYCYRWSSVVCRPFCL